jgi:transposase
MGRLSPYAKNRILNLRFTKSFRIKQIATSLLQEDNIKVSRKSISTFLKKYIETKSINDKPRSGRNKKLTPEEINLIGEITRLNRDITAPKIKEYLNLNVSTYTILRASKLFEWNKLNPNSNEAKKAAALERQLNGNDINNNKKRRVSTVNKVPKKKFLNSDEMIDTNDDETNIVKDEIMKLNDEDKLLTSNSNLNLITESEILEAKNASSSAMVFATKILYKIFDLNELIGHNVSGKTFNKYIKHKNKLDEKRITYIKWMIQTHYDTQNREEQWKACRTAINKSIRNNELKSLNDSNCNNNNNKKIKTNENISNNNLRIISLNEPVNNNQQMSIITLEPNMSIFQMTNDLDLTLNKIQVETNNIDKVKVNIVKLTEYQDENNFYLDSMTTKQQQQQTNNESEILNVNNLEILNESEILQLKSLYCSPMIFATKVLLKIYTKDELLGHNISGKTFHKNLKTKEPLDETRINYIKWLIENYFTNNIEDINKRETVWKSCRKAINRVIRSFEIKESKLIKSIDDEIIDSNRINSS